MLSLLFCCCHVEGRQDDVIRLQLRPEVLLDHARMVVADVLTVDAPDRSTKLAIEDLPLGGAPMIGYVERRTRAELEAVLRGQAFLSGRRVEWQGARVSNIRTQGRRIEGAALEAVARKYLLDTFGNHYDAMELILAAPAADLDAPMGRLHLAARMLAHPRLLERMPVWVDVTVDGRPYRSAVLLMHVVARKAVYTARYAMSAGSMVQAEDFSLVPENVAGLEAEPLASGALRMGSRLKQAIRQGEILTEKQVSAQGMVFRGDVVRLIVADSAMRLETSAYAQSDANVGEIVNVKPGQSSEVIAGRVVAAGIVQIDGR